MNELGEEWSDIAKICLAWRYGIYDMKFNTLVRGIDSIQNHALAMLRGKNSIDDIIKEMTRKRTPEEKENGHYTARKYCKRLPYMFTPALIQFALMGVTPDETKKIHKCYRDRVMDGIAYPNEYASISELYKLDWRSEYYKFICNPYAFYKLSLERCDVVIRNSCRDPNNFVTERYLGQISRFVSKQIDNLKWSATPEWLLENEFGNYKNHINNLRNNYGLIFDINLVYLFRIYEEELIIYNYIRLNNTREINRLDYKDSSDFIPTSEQKAAIAGAMFHTITIITGLAGTGKTSVIRDIVRLLGIYKKTCIACSFTAKATNRIKEVLGNTFRDSIVVQTIHSILSSDKFECPDFLIVDEATMISLSLMSRLFRIITGKNTNLIMLGDINQLPPIKYGRPFEDIINSEIVPIYKLTENLRVKGGIHDPIIVNSTDIAMTSCYQPRIANNFVINRNLGNINDIVRQNNITLQNISRHKFITAINDDNTELNRILSSFINRSPDEHSRNVLCYTNRKGRNGEKITVEMRYSVGDPVIFTKNKVYKGVSNGTEGIIVGFSTDKFIVVHVESTDIDVRVPLYPIKARANCYTVKHVLLAYSITVHKSQGSQWDNIYYYCTSSPSATFNNKRLAYTGITRAQEKCVIIDVNSTFTSCCRQPISQHYGGLSQRISSLANKILYELPQRSNETSYITTNVNDLDNDFLQLHFNKDNGMLSFS